jgi:hypothetical protein
MNDTRVSSQGTTRLKIIYFALACKTENYSIREQKKLYLSTRKLTYKTLPVGRQVETCN